MQAGKQVWLMLKKEPVAVRTATGDSKRKTKKKALSKLMPIAEESLKGTERGDDWSSPPFLFPPTRIPTKSHYLAWYEKDASSNESANSPATEVIHRQGDLPGRPE